ncbi:MAG: guanylate kinase [Opitutus sp.]|nr:guanylate kinase [Opitutus sp.]
MSAPVPALNSSTGNSAPPALLVIAGPAGSGKSTLCDRLVQERPEFFRVVTSTTRAPRTSEVDGAHYHFLTPPVFDAKIAAGEFLEWAWVHGERRYGTLKSSVLKPLAAGQDLVMSIDVQGVESLRRIAATDLKFSRSLTTVFIVVEHERLIARMRARAKDHEEEIVRRLTTAEAELREAAKFDFVIESKTRDEDFAELLKILGHARGRTNP